MFHKLEQMPDHLLQQHGGHSGLPPKCLYFPPCNTQCQTKVSLLQLCYYKETILVSVKSPLTYWDIHLLPTKS